MLSMYAQVLHKLSSLFQTEKKTVIVYCLHTLEGG
jgi:hypothetical protein